jgi:hypothetical protein
MGRLPLQFMPVPLARGDLVQKRLEFTRLFAGVGRRLCPPLDVVAQAARQPVHFGYPKARRTSCFDSCRNAFQPLQAAPHQFGHNPGSDHHSGCGKRQAGSPGRKTAAGK